MRSRAQFIVGKAFSHFLSVTWNLFCSHPNTQLIIRNEAFSVSYRAS